MKNRKLLILVSLLLLTVLAVGAVQAQDKIELRITWYNDGNEGEVLRAQLDQYEKDNPNIKVVIDTIAYKDLDTTLQPQVETGNAPDMARVTDVARYKGHYLDMSANMKDAKAWEAKWPAAVITWMRQNAEDKGLYGYMTQATVTGPLINRTFFEQAGVAVPSDKNPKATWQEWVDAAKAVAEKVSTPDAKVYAVAIDRSGHRVWGPALSNGAVFFKRDDKGSPILDDKGNVLFTVDSPGFRKTAEMIVAWHKEGITPPEIWIAAGGKYASGKDAFVNGQLVLFMSGSWQVGALAKDVGTKFDWEAIPTPCGEGGCTGMPGGAAVMAFKYTKYPKEVTALMEYLSSEAVLGEFSAKTLFIPAELGLATKGVAFETDLPSAKKSLNVFLAEVPKVSDDAWVLQTAKNGFALNTGIRERLTQAITGELSLDDAIKRIQQDVDDAAQK
jgi:alpha-1,4-digalacturonate transport system substrate-binding protein